MNFQLAIIGWGKWGKNHVRTANELFGEQLRYVCDTDTSKSEHAEAHDGSFEFVSSFEQILADDDINAVIIATPAETHYALAKAAIEKGKNVLVEKPLALHSKQARELDALARQQNVVLMVGHLLLYHPIIAKIKELVDSDVLGKLQYIYSNRLNLGTVRKEENILWSFAPHDISVLQHLIGDDPVEVIARGGAYLQPGIHDVTLTTLRYPNNIQAHIHVSWLHPFKEHRLVVIGDKNMVVFEDTRPEEKLILYPKGIDWVAGNPIKRDEAYQVIEVEGGSPLTVEQLHFRDCVVNGTEPLTGGRNAIEVLEILERAQDELEVDQVDTADKSADAYFVHETAVVDDGCEIGEGTRIWHYSHVQPGAKLGRSCSLGQSVNIANNVVIGDNVKIQNNVSVYEGVTLEDYVFCGPSMVFTNILNPRCEFPQRGADHYVKTLVEYGASLGANSTIVCGTNIGRFAFIGAGAVVTKDVPAYALMVGNPAKRVGWMCRCGTKLAFSNGRSTCENCSRDYSEGEGSIVCDSD